MTDGPLGKIYDLDEAAAYLRVSKSAVARAARRHGIGARFGRDIRFSEDDVRQMWDAQRAHPETSLQNSIPLRGSEKAFESLMKRAREQRAAKLLARGKKRS
ncbi:MAG: hypothetical protein C0458_21775 [Methylobacterium sp.]|nr:hypothetical protein [Methylobacterium sp.]